MSYFEEYKNQLNSKGATIGGSYRNATVDLINNVFHNSPFYVVVPINGVDTEVRVISGNTSKAKILTFRPETKFEKGSLVLLQGFQWLTMDFDNNDIYPKATIAKCNDTIKWQTSDSVIHEHPCVLTGLTTSFAFGIAEDKQMTLPTGELNIFVKYGPDTLSIKCGTRLIFGTKVYKLMVIDDITDILMGNGVLKLYIKLDTISEKDNFSTRLAENSAINGSTSGGGRLW